MADVAISLLPKPLPSASLSLGQILSHPLHPETGSFVSSLAPEVEELSDCFIHARYKDLFSLDRDGRFAQSYGAKFDMGKVWRKPNLVAVNAEQMISRNLENPAEAFETICGDPEARDWILQTVQNGADSLYFVAGIKELKNATFKRAKLSDGGISDKLLVTPLERDARVPRSVKVKEIAGSSGEPRLSGVFGLDVRRVRARINHPQEPHALQDLGYRWQYFSLPDHSNMQLIVGLGPPVTAEELRASFDPEEDEVAFKLESISAPSEHALSTSHSPMLRADTPQFRGRSPSPLPPALRM